MASMQFMSDAGADRKLMIINLGSIYFSYRDFLVSLNHLHAAPGLATSETRRRHQRKDHFESVHQELLTRLFSSLKHLETAFERNDSLLEEQMQVVTSESDSDLSARLREESEASLRADQLREQYRNDVLSDRRARAEQRSSEDGPEEIDNGPDVAEPEKMIDYEGSESPPQDFRSIVARLFDVAEIETTDNPLERLDRFHSNYELFLTEYPVCRPIFLQAESRCRQMIESLEATRLKRAAIRQARDS